MHTTTVANKRSYLLSLLCLLFWSISGWADLIPDAERISATQVYRVHAAPVVVNGNELFSIIGIKSFSAAQRAEMIADRIEAIAANDAIDPGSIEIIESDYHTDLVLDGDTIVAILDADAEHVGLATRQVIAKVYKQRIVKSIEEYRFDRLPEQIKGDLIKAGIRSSALILVLFLTLRLFKLFDRLIEKSVARRLKKLEAKSMRMLQSAQLWKAFRFILTLVKAVIILTLVYLFLHFVLALFPWTRYPAARLWDMVLSPVEAMASGLLAYLPSLFFLVILFLIARYILRLLRSFFDAVHYQNIHLKNFEPDWALPTYRIARIIVIIFATVVAYPYIPGSSSEAFKGISIFLGVLLSLGSTSIISNIIAGYTMTYRRAFRVGDRVRIGETIGDVLESRLLVTHINSLKNEKIVIPNSTILNSEVVNYTTRAKDKDLVLHTQVSIGYEIPWRQVEAMLIKAANQTNGLIKQPPPFVLQKALTDFAVTYELNVSCKNPLKMVELYSKLHQNIQDVFNEYGVQIMTPNYVADAPTAKLVPVEQWYTPPASKPAEES